MIKYKNFKFIIDVTYGALKFKKIYIYIIYQELKKIFPSSLEERSVSWELTFIKQTKILNQMKLWKKEYLCIWVIHLNYRRIFYVCFKHK